MIVKVFKSGNSLVVAIPSEVAKRYGIRVGDAMNIRVQNKNDRIILTYVKMKVRSRSSFFEPKGRG